jgi:hypothetical protein
LSLLSFLKQAVLPLSDAIDSTELTNIPLLEWKQYTLTSLAFLSPKRREAYSPTLALKGLGVRSVFHAIEQDFRQNRDQTGFSVSVSFKKSNRSLIMIMVVTINT